MTDEEYRSDGEIGGVCDEEERNEAELRIDEERMRGVEGDEVIDDFDELREEDLDKEGEADTQYGSCAGGDETGRGFEDLDISYPAWSG